MTLHPLVNFSVVIASSLFAIEQPNEERIGADCGPSLYRVGQMVVPLGLFDSDFYIPPPYPAPQPIMGRGERPGHGRGRPQ